MWRLVVNIMMMMIIRYGWHFPEMGKIVTENVPYAKAVKIMGMRTSCATSDFRSVITIIVMVMILMKMMLMIINATGNESQRDPFFTVP
jgi:RNA processing factor Prp31